MHAVVQVVGLLIILGQRGILLLIHIGKGLHELVELLLQQQGREVVVQRGIVAGLFLANAVEEVQGRFAQLRRIAQIGIEAVGVEAEGRIVRNSHEQSGCTIQLRIVEQVLAHASFTRHGIGTQRREVPAGVHLLLAHLQGLLVILLAKGFFHLQLVMEMHVGIAYAGGHDAEQEEDA